MPNVELEPLTSDEFLTALRAAVWESRSQEIPTLISRCSVAEGTLLTDDSTENPFYLALENNQIEAARLIRNATRSQIDLLLVGNRAIKDHFPAAYANLISMATVNMSRASISTASANQSAQTNNSTFEPSF